jgi:hypothetical protein
LLSGQKLLESYIMKLAIKSVLVSGIALVSCMGCLFGEKIILKVVIVDRQSHESRYTYFVPAQFVSHSNSTASCLATDSTVNCSGSTTTSGVSAPARSGAFDVKGATFSLQLPDGRIAVVNCDSKFAEHFAGRAGNHRDCRVPLVNELQTEFDGDKAKLIWPVSIDGKKMESETYKILGILAKP